LNPDQHCKTASTSAIAGWGTILIVEDDAGVRSLTRMMLGKLGYDVLTARDGMEAIETFEAHAHLIRLVISDLEMPRLGGWEVLAAIRRQRSELPVVLTSGHDANGLIAAHQYEFPPFMLNKPYTLETLHKVLESALVETFQYTSCANQS
jgi:CheY-like chemotaxis protein